MTPTSARSVRQRGRRPGPAAVAWLWRRRTTVLAPVVIYLTGQAIAVGLLAVLAGARHERVLGRLDVWDGQFFLRIAAHGYVFDPALTNSRPPAFFPGLPLLLAGFHGLTRLPYPVAAVAVSLVSGMVFAVGLARLAGTVARLPAGTGLVAVALLSVSPLSVVLTMAYSEAPFCALAVWALVAIRRGRYLTAGTLSLLAGLFRLSGLALAVALAATLLTMIVRRPHRAPWRLWLATALAPLGTLGWVLGTGLAMGGPTAWLGVQNAGWGSRFDLGRATWHYVVRIVTTAPSVLDVLTVAVLLAAVIVLVLMVVQRFPVALLAYGAAAVAEVLLTAGIMNSKIRLLVPAFVLLLPLAAALARVRRSTVVAVLVLLAALGGWFGGYALTIWPYAI